MEKTRRRNPQRLLLSLRCLDGSLLALSVGLDRRRPRSSSLAAARLKDVGHGICAVSIDWRLEGLLALDALAFGFLEEERQVFTA